MKKVPDHERHGNQPVKEVKAIVFGPRGFGKTRLINELFPGCKKEFVQGTDGKLETKHYIYDFHDKGGTCCRINIWKYDETDFNKKVFPRMLTESTLYLFVWNNNVEGSRDDFSRWFNKIKPADRDAETIFVVTHDDAQSENRVRYDRIICGLNRSNLNISFEFLGRTTVDGKKSKNYDSRLDNLKKKVLISLETLSKEIKSENNIHMEIKKYILDRQHKNKHFVYSSALSDSIGLGHKQTSEIIEALYNAGSINYYKFATEKRSSLLVFDIEWLNKIYENIIAYCHHRSSRSFTSKEFLGYLSDSEIYPEYIHIPLFELLINIGLLSNPTAEQYYINGYGSIALDKLQKEWIMKRFENNCFGKELFSRYQYNYSGINGRALFDSFFECGNPDYNNFTYENKTGFIWFGKKNLEDCDSFAHITLENGITKYLGIQIYTLSGNKMQHTNPLLELLRSRFALINNGDREYLKVFCTKRHVWQKRCEQEPCKWNYYAIRDKRFRPFRPFCLCYNGDDVTHKIMYPDLY